MRPDTQQWIADTKAPNYLERLRDALRRHQVSQAAFARECRCSPSFIGQVLRGNAGVPKYIWERGRQYVERAPTAGE